MAFPLSLDTWSTASSTAVRTAASVSGSNIPTAALIQDPLRRLVEKCAISRFVVKDNAELLFWLCVRQQHKRVLEQASQVRSSVDPRQCNGLWRLVYSDHSEALI